MSHEEREALELIDEYLEEVRRYLPEDIADDVIEELRTHIIDKATEMGGLTVRNVYRIIRDLGEPRQLASKYVVGGGKRVLKFELGISEDIYPYFIQLVFWITLFLVIGYSVRIVYIIAYSSGITSILTIVLVFAEMLASILLTIIFLYIVMSFFSSNPDLKEMLRNFLKDLFGETEKKPKRKDIKLEVKAKDFETRIREIGQKLAQPMLAFPTLLIGFTQFILSYIIYIYGFALEFNWLMQLLLYSLIIYLLTCSLINIAHYFYISYTEKKSYLVGILKSLVPFVFVPWLILSNIFTTDIQLLTLDIELFKKEDYENILNYVEIIPIPSEYIPLAKLITLLLLIVIIVNAIVVLLRYSRTIPRMRAEEKLLRPKVTDALALHY